jgi:cobyrinic acid a,c-diamide synthase
MQYARSIDVPRILIAALRGGSGKTVVSIGIIASLAQSGKTVSPFKKGPDYIDAGWLAMAAGRPCHNLDSFLFEDHLVSQSFVSCSQNSDIAVIEGNRGLYDGLDAAGSTSSAALAVLLQAPVILCADCTGSTRTMAALVMGCMHFDPRVKIGGVILNRVAGSRHENLLRECIEAYCGIPVVGAIPKLPGQDFPERHMGLIPTPEHAWASSSIDSAVSMAQNYIDLDAVFRIARDAVPPPLEPVGRAGVESPASQERIIQPPLDSPPRIGIVKDSAFQFYYPENIKAIADAGATLVYMSPLEMKEMPEVDGLYIGGGFPETHASELSENVGFRNALKAGAADGLPIYAECGGLIYLGESLVLDRVYPMAGVLPIVFGFSKRPQGHGYTIVVVNRENPYYAKGTELKGHEFHYSKVIEWKGKDADLVFDMKKGRGFYNSSEVSKDGVCMGNVMATYTHIHALGCPQWAQSLVKLAKEYRRKAAQS